MLWDKYAIVHFRGSYLEAGIADIRPPNRLLGIIGRGWASQLHVQSTKPPIRYLVDSQALIFLSALGNGILNRNQTTWANTDTRLTPRSFYEPPINQKIAIRELGGGRRLMIPCTA